MSHYDLKLIEPKFNSNLTDLIIDLNALRKKQLSGTTRPIIFFQLKYIFHFMESIGSARIEGNNTTILDYIETKIDEQTAPAPDGIKEIQNIEAAMTFIEDNVDHGPINKLFVSELHKMIVKDLKAPPDGEGDLHPGKYREVNLKINKSQHVPPDFLKVEEYMEELLNFINKPDPPKYDLLKAAIAHHRFVWIHPFCNGNGRTVRLFTYAMLVKTGFNVRTGRILNPTAVFCSDRNVYYEQLSQADSGTDEGILTWSEYVLNGLRSEIEKIDKLLDYNFLKKDILVPSINYALERKLITEIEGKILRRCVEHQIVKASDLSELLNKKHGAQVSREIKKLIDKKMLVPTSEGGRKYTIGFQNSYLLRGIVQSLDNEGFLPIPTDK
jgi:Fic family protein